MIPNAVLRVVRQERRNVTGIVTMVPDRGARCSLRYALSVVKTPKCRSSLVKVDQSTAVSATAKPNKVGKAIVT